MRVLRRDDYELDAADSGDESSQGSCLRFRQFFESHFEALDRPSSPTKNTTAENDNDSFDSDQEECEGVSNVDLHKPIFIDHGTTAALTAQITQSGRRSFMDSRPPTLVEQPTKGRNKRAETVEDTTEREAANIRKDQSLQKLLRESGLLDTPRSDVPIGIKRHRAMDIQLQDLGSKSSIYAQPSMPLSQRRGIQAKAAAKDKARRESALEDGIILEKVITRSKKTSARRTRFVGTPSIGRFQGGTLKLSKKDIADIKGPTQNRRRIR